MKGINAARVAAVGSIVVLALSAQAPASFAGTVKPHACPPDLSTTVSNSKAVFVPDPGKIVYGDSGTTLTVSAAAGSVLTGTVSGSGEIDESLIVVAAKQTISASIAYSKTTTVTLSGSWKVPSSQSSGWLAIGSQGYSMNWKTTRTNGNCSGESTLGSGTAKLPAQTPYVAHS
ncbi:hypothetical protein ACIQGZ_25810 [Streptomyces sp. NPDC092296]|uniref:hypothetical protein n=1 Tax=Streptomyces sp. NPDC092296 TaxID=3366012 RepID=UPI00381F9528